MVLSCQNRTRLLNGTGIVQYRKQELHLQELYSSAQAFLALRAKIRNINVAHFAEQKRLASRYSQKCEKNYMLHFCSNSRLADPRSDYTSLSYIPLKFPLIAQYLLISTSEQKRLLNDYTCRNVLK